MRIDETEGPPAATPPRRNETDVRCSQGRRAWVPTPTLGPGTKPTPLRAHAGKGIPKRNLGRVPPGWRTLIAEG